LNVWKRRDLKVDGTSVLQACHGPIRVSDITLQVRYMLPGEEWPGYAAVESRHAVDIGGEVEVRDEKTYFHNSSKQRGW
jgi:hypothetical protein